MCSAVIERLEKHSTVSGTVLGKGAPAAMLALADYISCTLLARHSVGFDSNFCGLCYTVPPAHTTSAQYHSIVGQKLYVVDWLRFDPKLELPCPNSCGGCLQPQRTNYSKNRVLFPIFSMEGAPAWAIVMIYKCDCCGRLVFGNEGELLVKLPEFAALAYPVEPKYARGKSHVSRTATANIMEELMLTYGNGELCSRLLYGAINKDYTIRVLNYLSWCKSTNNQPETYYPARDGGLIVKYPPLGQLSGTTTTWQPSALGISGE